MPLLHLLQALPDEWGLVAVDGQKRPYKPAWQNNPLTKPQAAVEINAARAKAIGVLAGPTSGGLLFLDHDGPSAIGLLEELGIPIRSLPRTPAVTSGRDGRFQLLFHVPPTYWDQIRTRKFKTSVPGEQVELRWAGCQSVVIGQHPTTGAYRWLRNRSPQDLPIADAPTALIELMLTEPEPDPTPLLTPASPPPITVQTHTLPLLDFVTRDSRDLITSGGTPGSWNDDHLRLSLDLIGTEDWIRHQGHTPDITARDAFAQHIAAARTKARDFDERKAWKRFDGAPAHSPHPGTPEPKLLDRLAFHTRTPRPKPTPTPPPHTSPSAPQAQPPPISSKPIKIEVPDVLAILRSQNIRFNTFSQQVEVNGQTLTGAERFYIALAEQGYKVAKDLAIDCLLQVAHENPYDPVTLYLDHVAATVHPTYIESLSTTYLRPGDASQGQPTLYDHMLRCTLIGAVRRAFEPGSKHDTALVLMGDQGGRKSSFWSVLGGPFFSDSLGDLSSKDDLLRLHRSWLMEWAELDHITSRKHAGSIKAFLTQQVDLFRVPYGRSTEAFPRRGIIVGSTNRNAGFLQDETGNRRFWVIPTTATESTPIDTATLAHERDAIWSAAVHAYRNGDPSHLPPELAQQVADENRAYIVDNPWQAVIEAFLSQPKNHGKTITSELLLTEAIQKPVERQTRADQMQVSNLMRDLGFEKRRKSVDGILRWVFLPTSADPIA